MKKLTTLIIYCLSLHISYSQPYNPEKVNKKAVQLYNQAIERGQDGNLISAAGLLLQCIELDKKYVDAYLALASVYGQIKNYKSSTDYYEKAFALDSDYTIEYKLSYSINLAGLGEFEKALNAINELLTKKPPKNATAIKTLEYRKRSYEFAIDYTKKNAGKLYVFIPKNTGSGVNSGESEYSPSLTIDGNELVFTRKVKNFNEDFYYSKKKTIRRMGPGKADGRKCEHAAK